jgi:hypothetical protein
LLHFKRADVYTTVYHPIKAWSALIVERRRREARITTINGRAARQQRMCKCRTTVTL